MGKAKTMPPYDRRITEDEYDAALSYLELLRESKMASRRIFPPRRKNTFRIFPLRAYKFKTNV